MKIIETKVEAKLVKKVFGNEVFYSVVINNQYEDVIEKDWYYKLVGKEEKFPRDSKGRFIKRS